MNKHLNPRTDPGHVDLNWNNEIDYGVDTVFSSETVPALQGSVPVYITTGKVWQPGDTSSAGGSIVSTSMRSPSGLSASSQSIGIANPATSLTTLSGNGNWTTTSTAPDGTKQVQTYTNGLLASSSSLNTENSTLTNSSFAYDILNRLETTTDSRTGPTTTNYLSTTSDTVASVIDPGNRTTAFAYDIRGRQIAVDAPDTLDSAGVTLANVTTTAYNPDGTVQETNGGQTYRTTNTYDYAQRLVTMTTYGTEQATTYWHYSPTRGFLTRKAYQDGKGTDYTYTKAGRLATRTWARGVGTAYGYDDGGRLVTITYSDDTPDVALSYDALGRQVTQSNGLATTTYAYNLANLAPDTETITYNLPGLAPFIRVLDRSQDALNRDTGWQIKDGTTIENEVAYAYGATDGRISSISNPQLSNVSFAYGYVPGSSLIADVTGPAHTVTNIWEPSRDVLDLKENKAGSTVVSSFDYTVNALGQRSDVSQAGTAFQAVRSIAWGYDSLGQVTSADSSLDTGDRAYQYDAIGNRLQSSAGVSPAAVTSYTPNPLNQYSAITNPQSTILNPTYDSDGNMTSGPLPADPNSNSTLTWDGENRLIESTVGTSGPLVRYFYDSQSRKIAETNGTNTIITIYDAWNPIAEYSQSGTGVPPVISKTFTWGTDLSGSMQGAGGVGGLLSVTDHGLPITAHYFPTYDGNGNVSEYLDAADAIQAHYEYDPFGNTVVNTDAGNLFVHRFSTKPLDQTTGLYYYGYRFYDPVTGRWSSRDPVHEQGHKLIASILSSDITDGMTFVNSYVFVGNIPTVLVDSDGRFVSYAIAAAVAGAALTIYAISQIWNAANDVREDLEDAGDSMSDALKDPSNSDEHLNDACDAYGRARNNIGELADEAADSATMSMPFDADVPKLPKP